MVSKCKLNEHSLNTGLCNINNNNILNHNTNRISILNNNNTLYKGGVETLEVKDNNNKDHLDEEEAKSYVIIMHSQDIFLKIFSKSCKTFYIF